MNSERALLIVLSTILSVQVVYSLLRRRPRRPGGSRPGQSAEVLAEDSSITVAAQMASNDSQGSNMSFIEKCKVFGANALLGIFVANEGFDATVAGLKVERISSGQIDCTLEVHEGVLNGFGSLHGGCICTLVDVVGTMAFLTLNSTKPGVSIELNCSFLSPTKLGETIRISGKVLKMGKNIGFSEVEIFNNEGKLLASGRHTKAL